jgi:integrase
VRPSTLTRYKLDTRTLTRELGSMRLQALTGSQIDALYAKRVLEGASAASVRHLHAVSRRALRDAVKNGLVMRNAADAATPPRVTPSEPRTWTPTELRTFLIALDTGTEAELRAHRVRQAQERLALGLGSQARDTLVFTDPLGEPVKPDSFRSSSTAA